MIITRKKAGKALDGGEVHGCGAAQSEDGDRLRGTG